jgi:hypothetical protein
MNRISTPFSKSQSEEKTNSAFNRLIGMDEEASFELVVWHLTLHETPLSCYLGSSQVVMHLLQDRTTLPAVFLTFEQIER